MQQRELIDRLRALRPQLAAEGVEHLLLYGSRARQDNEPTSDIDLLVDFASEARPTILNLIGVEHIVGDSTGIPAHVAMRAGLDEKFQARIRPDLIEVF